MKEINYLEILKKSWKITWQNKYLWWFGFFMALGGGISNFNFSNSDWENSLGTKKDLINDFIANNWEIFLIVILALIALGIMFFIFKIIAQAGLIKTLEKIEKSEEGNFKLGFKEGKKYFWKIFLIGLILGMMVFILLVILALPVGLLFYFKALLPGILATILAIAIFIPLAVLASFMGKYSYFYVVLSQLGIKDSLENSYQVFRKNIFSSIIMALLFIPIGIIMGIIFFVALILTGIVFLLIGLALNALFSKIGIAIAIISGGIIFLAFLIFSSSIYQVFWQTAWFLFFREIARVEKEEVISLTETENISEKESIPNPEEA